jgi:pimeloyl-ACP methyl ester carboxylesterase
MTRSIDKEHAMANVHAEAHHTAAQYAARENNPAREHLLATLPVRERRLPLAGISTPVLEGGDGPPVVLLHGPGGYGAHWMRVIPGLVATHRVIAPDLPGHGTSDIGATRLTAAGVLAWLEALIDATCASPPTLVAHLAAGAIAARFAHSHAGRIESLVLVDTFGLQPFDPAPQLGSALNSLLTQPDARTHDELWRYCAFDLDRLRKSMGATWDAFAAYNLDRIRQPGVRAAVHSLVGLFGAAIPPAELASIAVPTRLIWGRNDLATPLAVAADASKRYGWPLHVIENANDDPPVEQPAALLAVLRTLLPTKQQGAR